MLLDLIAEGGMARVFRGVRRSEGGFEKPVAIKCMLPELASDLTFVERFTDEAHIASTLNHANIVQVFDFGRQGDEYFLVMELVAGTDLGRILSRLNRKGERMPLPAVLFVASETLWGLGAAHRRCDATGRPAPVVHRDMSPQNILVAEGGSVKVADFGIAKAAGKLVKTRAGMIMGKYFYMSPEQARGEPVDARSDIFSTAAVIWEMLCGRPLFAGETPEEVLRQVVRGCSEPASRRHPDLPSELDAILARALDLDRERRHADGNMLARDLVQLLHRLAPGYSREDLGAWLRSLDPRQADPTRSTPRAGALSEGEPPNAEAAALAETPLRAPREGLSSDRLSDGPRAATVQAAPGSRRREAAAAPQPDETRVLSPDEAVVGPEPERPGPRPTFDSGATNVTLDEAVAEATPAEARPARLLTTPGSPASEAKQAEASSDPDAVAPSSRVSARESSLDISSGTLALEARGGRLRWAVVWGLVLCVGGLGGWLGGSLVTRPPGSAAVAFHRGQPVQHGAWSVELLALEPGASTNDMPLVLELRVKHPSLPPIQAGPAFWMEQHGTRRPPLFWTIASDAEPNLRLVFPRVVQADKPLRLGFHPTDAEPLLLELP